MHAPLLIALVHQHPLNSAILLIKLSIHFLELFHDLTLQTALRAIDIVGHVPDL